MATSGSKVLPYSEAIETTLDWLASSIQTLKLDLPKMGLLKTVERVEGPYLSTNPDIFTIEQSAVEGGGMACFAASSLPQGTTVIRFEEPVASVIVSSFRKEVCHWCYAYDLGATPKVKIETGRGRGVAWFCTVTCRNSWNYFIGTEGLHCIMAFEDGLGRGKSQAKSNRESEKPDEHCDLDVIKNRWEDAFVAGERIISRRRAKPHVSLDSATLPSTVDLDDARFILSGLLSFHNRPQSLHEVLQMAPSMSPYTKSKNTLQAHISIYHYLLSVLPLNSPILNLVTPTNLIAIITRDAGNTWGIWDENLAGHELLAYCLYPAASYFNHSCEPNIYKERDGRAYHFRVKTDLAAGEELTVSYLGDAEKTLDWKQRGEKLLVSSFDYELSLAIF